MVTFVPGEGPGSPATAASSLNGLQRNGTMGLRCWVLPPLWVGQPGVYLPSEAMLGVHRPQMGVAHAQAWSRLSFLCYVPSPGGASVSPSVNWEAEHVGFETHL